MALAVVQTVAWTLVTAPLQGPDESGHFSYVQHLAETGHPPSPSSGHLANSTEVNTALLDRGLGPLVGNAAARPAWSQADVRRWRVFERHLPGSARKDGDGPNALAKNPPLYYAIEALAYRAAPSSDLFTRLEVLRLLNGLFFLLNVGFMWLAAGEVFRRMLPRTVATATLALEPKLAFLAGVINPDTLLATLFTLFVWQSLRLLRLGPTPRRIVGLVSIATATILTHGRGLAILPALLVAIGLAFWRFRPAWRQALVAVGGGAVVMLGGLFAYRAWSHGSPAYGGEATLGSPRVFNLRQFLSSIYQFYFPKLASLKPRLGPSYGYRQVFIEQFYGTLGSLEVKFPARVNDWLQVASAIGLLTLWTAVVALRDVIRPRLPQLAILMTVATSTIFLLHLASYRALANGAADPLITGRYLAPLTSLLGLAIGVVVAALPRKLAPLLAALVVATGLMLELAGLGLSVTRFYA